MVFLAVRAAHAGTATAVRREHTAVSVLGTLFLAKTLYPEAYGEAMYKDAARELYETYYGFTPDEAQL